MGRVFVLGDLALSPKDLGNPPTKDQVLFLDGNSQDGLGIGPEP